VLFAGGIELAGPFAAGFWLVPIVILGGAVDIVPLPVTCPLREPVAQVQFL
jgi:hypothetical protein